MIYFCRWFIFLIMEYLRLHLFLMLKYLALFLVSVTLEVTPVKHTCFGQEIIPTNFVLTNSVV